MDHLAGFITMAYRMSVFRMVYSCHSIILHAFFNPCCCKYGQLRTGGVCCVYTSCFWVVLGLGVREVCWATNNGR